LEQNPFITPPASPRAALSHLLQDEYIKHNMAAKKKNTKPAKAKVAKAASSSSSSSSSSVPSESKSANEKSSRSSSPNTKTSTTSTSLVVPINVLLMAIVAFLGGVLTPPSLHMVREGVNPIRLPEPPTSPSFPLPPHIPCTPANLDNYIHASPVPGLHVVCIEPIYLGTDGVVTEQQQQHLVEEDTIDIGRRLRETNSLRLTFYKGSHAAPLRRRVQVSGVKNTNNNSNNNNNNNNNPAGVGAGVDNAVGVQQTVSWLDIKTQLIAELQLDPEGPTQQPWAVFTALGERIVGESDSISRDAEEEGSNEYIVGNLAASGMVIVAQGGNWMWPGVREGFQRTIELTSPPSNPNADSNNNNNHDHNSNNAAATTTQKSHNITIETLSLKPLVLSIEGFLTNDECDYIAKKAHPTMKYSSVSLKDADVGRAASDWRTSQSTFLSANDDPTLRDIEYRTGSLTRTPRNHQEYVQVLRYGTGEKYDAHHDYFDPAAYKSDTSTLNLIQYGKKNRFATVFWYLTDVEDGGHTIFPRAGGLPPVRSHSDCSRGLKVQPKKGKVIIFYSLDARGKMDPLSLHGACPVGEGGVKWAANKWIWNAPMSFVRN